jgi:hypothetical protein
VYGPSGCGKSTNAERIRAHFGLTSIVDDFDPIRKGCSLSGVLYLTADPRSRKTRAKSSLVKVRDYADVMAEIEARAALTPSIEQLQAVAKPTPFLTDWIPCTTPPVREGESDLTANINIDVLYPVRIKYSGDTWLRMDGSPFFRDSVDELADWSWRGARRWVLVQRNEPILGCDAYIEHRTPTNTKWTNELAGAKGFDTEAQALAYRDKGRWPFGLAKIVAVLP